jgi:glutamate racemase
MQTLDLRADGPVGVFDSGIGGLSVVSAIRSRLPREDLIYVADTGHLPYGEKTSAYIVERAMRITDYLLGRGAKAIAIPCNTATAAAVAALRLRHPSLAIVGIEPAVKPAARLTRSGVIGVLATTGTLMSEKFQQLVSREAPDTRVLLKPCPGWVDLVEQGADPALAQRMIALPLEELVSQGADVLVLGCTHFPFLIDPIRQCVGPDFPVLETGPAFARELQRQLSERQLLNEAGQGTLQIYTSSEDPAAVQQRMHRLSAQWGPVSRLPAAYC